MAVKPTSLNEIRKRAAKFTAEWRLNGRRETAGPVIRARTTHGLRDDRLQGGPV